MSTLKNDLAATSAYGNFLVEISGILNDSKAFRWQYFMGLICELAICVCK
jgi:hypothetical protein